jgi:GxxExxY protein
VPLRICYKGLELAARYRADLVCYGEVIVELKAVPHPAAYAEAQVLNYLKASGLPRGLMLNFGTPSLEYRRFVFSPASHLG